MADRMDLHRALKQIYSNVYFQLPENTQMSYPCIKYKRSGGDTKYADGKVYGFTQQYELIAINKDPDSGVVEELIHKFPMIQYNRHYVADNLNHDVFLIYW